MANDRNTFKSNYDKTDYFAEQNLKSLYFIIVAFLTDSKKEEADWERSIWKYIL